MDSPILLDMASRHIFERLFHLKIIVTFLKRTQNIVHMALFRGLGLGVGILGGVLRILLIGFIGAVVFGLLLILFALVGGFVFVALILGFIGILTFFVLLAFVFLILLILLILLLLRVILRRILRVELLQMIEGRRSLGAQQKLGFVGVIIMHDLVRH